MSQPWTYLNPDRADQDRPFLNVQDARQSFGFVPELLRRFPAEALPGAWLSFPNVEMNPQGALPDCSR
jgi:hypothetical protein